MALGLVLLAVGCKDEGKRVEAAPSVAATTAAVKGARIVELKVTEEGFVPTPIKVKKGEPLVLKITRTTEKTCATEILIADTDINTKLPLNEAVDVAYTPAKSGEIQYGCAMGMMISGVLLVE